MSLTFSDLQTEVFARGYDHLNDASTGLARVKRRINERMADICDRAEWPFLYTDFTPGAAPLSITDLRAVLSVSDTTNDRVLQGMDRRTLNELAGTDLTVAGTPSYWYRNSETSVAVYPPSTTAVIAVRYVKFPAELSAAGDTPVIPSRFEWLMIEGAVADLKRDESDWGGAQACEAKYEDGIAKMLSSYWNSQLDGPDLMVTSDASTDW